MSKLTTFLLDLLYPPKCVYCNCALPSSNQHACEICKQTKPFLQNSTRPLTGEYFHSCYSVAWYSGNIRKAMIAYKFQRKRYYVSSFSIALSECISHHYTNHFDVITWVPASKKTVKSRTYDQSYLLAMSISKKLKTPILNTIKTSDDKIPQSSLTHSEERTSNIKTMFSLLPTVNLDNKRVLLIDDIVTTGATLNEIARIYKNAGAAEVICATFCRTKLENSSH